MSKRHSFDQSEVLMLGFTKRQKNRAWLIFTEVLGELGLKVSVTGGNFLTHEINCTGDDFDIILGLTKEQV